MNTLNSTLQKEGLANEQTIGGMVTKDFRKADVFKKHGLDFCCGGKKTLLQACTEKNIDFNTVESELNALDNKPSDNVHDFASWNADFLVDYILNTHHAYIRKAIPILKEYAERVAKVHGKEHEEVITINELFSEASDELLSHMHKEENILFPYVKLLQTEVNNKTKMAASNFATIKQPISMMELEHDLVGNIFKTIRELSSNYTPPESACTTYRVLYLKLNEFEADLHQHIHLENNILFPKSIELEILTQEYFE